MNCFRLSGSALPDDVLGRDRGAADDEEVDPGVDDGLAYAWVFCGDSAPAAGTPALADLGDPLADQLRLDRLGVDLLHPPGRRARVVDARRSPRAAARGRRTGSTVPRG